MQFSWAILFYGKSLVLYHAWNLLPLWLLVTHHIPRTPPENSNSQSGVPKYFQNLERLRVMGSFFLIQHLLSFIDSPYLKSIEVYPFANHVTNEHESENLFIPSMTIIASKWPQSLKKLFITRACAPGPTRSVNGGPRFTISKRSNLLTVLTGLHEMQSFDLKNWMMGNMDDDVRRLVVSWPKLKNFEGAYSWSVVYFLVDFKDNCGETVLNCVICTFIWILLLSHLLIFLPKAFTTIWRF